MSFISVFDVLGPKMVGPSSSHTAGACAIAGLAQKICSGRLKKVEFTLYGTDQALLGGIMGFATDDIRIRDSLSIARERGLEFVFKVNTEETDIHPNTVDIRMISDSGQEMTVRGESLGGGKVRIARIDQVEVDFTGEYNAVIVIQQDRPGVAAHITRILSEADVNIAFMRIFRESKGEKAYTIVESDNRLPGDIKGKLLENPLVEDVMIVQNGQGGGSDD